MRITSFFQIFFNIFAGLGVSTQTQIVFNRERTKNLTAFRALANAPAHAHVRTQAADVFSVEMDAAAFDHAILQRQQAIDLAVQAFLAEAPQGHGHPAAGTVHPRRRRHPRP